MNVFLIDDKEDHEQELSRFAVLKILIILDYLWKKLENSQLFTTPTTVTTLE